jgi:hypothetical protein
MSKVRMHTLYIVQKANWAYNDEWAYAEGSTPLKAFLSREAAEAHRQECEAAARFALCHPDRRLYPNRDENANPVAEYGGFTVLTSLTYNELLDRLHEIGVLKLSDAATSPHYYENLLFSDSWWGKLFHTTSPEMQEKLWEIFDKLRFFEIVEADWKADEA